MMKQAHVQNTQSQTNSPWAGAITRAALETAIGDPHIQQSSVKANVRRSMRMLRGGFALEVDIEGMILELNLPGIVSRYQIAPVVTALEIAAGVAATKRSLLQIASKLQTLRIPDGYLSMRSHESGANILDDTAAPTEESMLAGLKSLSAIAHARRVAILEDATDAIGSLAPRYAEMILYVGKKPLQQSSTHADIHVFESGEEATNWFHKYIRSSDTMLLSGKGLKV